MTATSEVAAAIAVADIPVHVARKRTRARSPGSNPAHQSMLNVPGPIAEFGVITQGHWGTSREKPITIVFCTCSFSGRFCIFFCQGQVWGEPAVANQPRPRGGLSTSGTGRRAQPRSARRGKVARTAATQCGHRSAALLPLVFQCLCMCITDFHH